MAAGTTRREFLTALLGAPVAAAAAGCARAPSIAFDGRMLGGPDAIGHKLRDGFRPSNDARASSAKVVIVGGGVSGLAAAWRFERAGFRDYRLLELDDVPGGTARGGETAISRHPWGAHYLPCPLPHARAVVALLEEMGVCEKDADGQLTFDETHLCRAPQERLFVGDRFYEGLFPRAGASAEDLGQLAAFMTEMGRFARLRDGRGRRAFAVPIACGSDDADLTALDRLSMDEWMRSRGYTAPRLRWFVEYACRDDFGATLADTSAWAGIHYFAARHDEGRTADLLTWPEGNARLVAHMARAAGPRVETGALALDVKPLPRGAEVLAFRPATGEAERITAEQVIVCVPRAMALRLVAPYRESPPAWARAFQSGAWLVANLTLSRAPRSRGFPLAWDNVLFRSQSLGYVVATHQLDPGACAPAPGDPCSRRAPIRPGESVWTWYLPLTDADPAAARKRLLALGWRETADLVLADLMHAHKDIDRCITRLDAWRWGHAMVRPHKDFIWSGALQAAARPLGDVHFAHSDLSGLPLFEEAQYHGVRAAEAVLAARGASVETLL